MPLLDAGVQIYEYTAGFVHMKTLVSDDRYGMSGTINMDYRSLMHHYEDAVWMYRTEIIPDMKSDMEQTISASMRIEKENLHLPLWQKLLKSVVQLFAPLM